MPLGHSTRFSRAGRSVLKVPFLLRQLHGRFGAASCDEHSLAAWTRLGQCTRVLNASLIVHLFFARFLVIYFSLKGVVKISAQ